MNTEPAAALLRWSNAFLQGYVFPSALGGGRVSRVTRVSLTALCLLPLPSPCGCSPRLVPSCHAPGPPQTPLTDGCHADPVFLLAS